MNELQRHFGEDKLAVLGFPSNQFGHQENTSNDEILNALKYIRPGNNFEPDFYLFEKILVNGKNEDPLFSYLKETLPSPSDDPVSLMGNPDNFIWKPVKRTDIGWNFEKFLVAPNGLPYKRYSKSFETINIKEDIEALIADFGLNK